MTQHSELKVTFENAPPGMKIIDVPGKADPLMKITHDVGYSLSFSTIMQSFLRSVYGFILISHPTFITFVVFRLA